MTITSAQSLNSHAYNTKTNFNETSTSGNTGVQNSISERDSHEGNPQQRQQSSQGRRNLKNLRGSQ